jgi:uncharacterized membrane protein YfcA
MILTCFLEACQIIGAIIGCLVVLGLMFGGWFYMMFERFSWKILVLSFAMSIVGATIGVWLHHKFPVKDPVITIEVIKKL